MKDKLLEYYKSTFNKFKSCELAGVSPKEWDRLMDEDPEFVEAIRRINEERAEEIKAELIMKENKSTAEIKLALELLTSTTLSKPAKTPGKHSKSQSGKEKQEWIKTRKELIADE